ncbi:hypothetical protein KR067_000250, partial [Drosophila pandora]
EFVVEKICGKRFNCGRPELLVKWMGFPEQDNSWEPLENLGNCIQMVCDFEAELFTKTCGKNSTVAIPRDLVNLSPKPPMATRSTFMANAPKKLAPVRSAKRKLESPKKRRQSSASSSISSQSAAKNSSSKSQTRSAPPLSVSLLNDLDLSEQSDEEVLVSTLQMLPPLKPPESDNRRNSVPVKESLEKGRETSPRERNLSSSSSSSSCLLSSTGSESDSTQTSKTSDTSNASKTSRTRQASLDPPPTSKCLPPTEKSPSPTKLLPSSPKPEKADGDLLSSLKMKARQTSSSSGSSRISPSTPAWKMAPSKKATVFGLKRGLPLDKVFHRFRLKDKTFLIVLWKGCSQPDAVLLDEIQDIYPLQVIQYFESLKLRYDA